MGVASCVAVFQSTRSPILASAILILAMTPIGAESRLGDPAVPTQPQTRETKNAPNMRADIRVDGTLVLIPVTVTDTFNRLVTDLVKEDFQLFEQNKEQKILSFSSDDTPVSIGLVFDCSGSMENKLAKSRAAVAALLQTASPEDEFFLVEFNDRVRLAQPFTMQAREIESHLESAKAKGATSLLDAVWLALREMKEARNPRKALVIVSDGGDNNSRYTESEIENLVKEADVQVFAIGIFGYRDPHFPAPEEEAGPGLLSRIAAQTGGRQYSVAKLDDLPDLAEKIGVAFRHGYILGYTPQDLPHNGKYRRVDVKLKRSGRSQKLRTSWRHGYFAPAN